MANAFSDWLRRFRALHERAGKDALDPAELAAYDSMRDELARTMLAAQKVSLPPGQQARQALRVARALQIDVDLAGESHRTVTLDLSIGGFSTLLPRPPPVGGEVGVALRLPGAEPIECRARITSVKPMPGSARVAAQFLELREPVLKRLERVVIDAVLALLPP